MKKHYLKLLLIALVILPSIIFAQDFNGYRQSNYSGVSGGDLNPANIADNRLVVDVTLGGFSMTTYNNHLYFNPHQMPFWWTSTFVTDENGDYQSGAAEQYANDTDFGIIPYSQTQDSMNASTGAIFEFDNPKGKPRAFHYNHDIDIMNVMVTINPKMAISLGIKQRTFLNVDHLSPELLTLATNSLEYPDLWNVQLADQLLNISFNSWNEYNIGFGMVVMDEKEHFLKAGIKLKFLQGLGSAYVYTDDVKYDFLNDDTATVIQGHFDYGYSDNVEGIMDGSANVLPNGDADIMAYATDFVSKLGLGTDLGIVYEWRPDWKDHKYDMDGETNIWRMSQNKYKLKASFAINDIGGMRYLKGGESRDFTVDIDEKVYNTVFDLDAFEDTDGLVTFNQNVDTLVQEGKATYTNDKLTYYMNLPTHITSSVDWHIWKAFYLNAGAFIGLQMNKNAHKVRYPTSFGITPRYDFAWAGISAPISYGSLTGFRTGLGLRMGPIIIGTADLKPFFAPGKDKKISGADIYFAVKIPILRTEPKDIDLDKVSDKLDLCKETPGIWEFKGCPDTDGDGIQDSEDACPTEPGLREFQGCPDRDGDKIIDSKDDCPDDAGLVEFNGCPDKDDDKIIDKNDDCPEVAGIAAFNGCPDTDGDGIKDSEDLCPDNAGPKENQGCPDTDNDGIFDYLDECPTEAGPQENRGCPWPDTDGDGLLDKDDTCPYNAGPAENEGCPYVDTDGDGVLDKDDACVNTPGPVENKGCPVVDLEILKRAFDALQFETSKAVIKNESFASLEDLANYLVENPELRLKIAGHTDSQGKAQSNLILSKKRAESVRDFLESRGVAADRMIVQYYGEEQPIATNDTAEGREENRRVAMEVMFE
jgi:outer membrane protein OmpA-like peptidoglycan-associated protein